MKYHWCNSNRFILSSSSIYFQWMSRSTSTRSHSHFIQYFNGKVVRKINGCALNVLTCPLKSSITLYNPRWLFEACASKWKVPSLLRWTYNNCHLYYVLLCVCVRVRVRAPKVRTHIIRTEWNKTPPILIDSVDGRRPFNLRTLSDKTNGSEAEGRWRNWKFN